jgi:beta-xylosidase
MNLTTFASVALAASSLVTRGASPSAQLAEPLGQSPPSLQDPFIFSDAKKYYLFGGAPGNEGFQCYESPDLIHWSLDGWAWRMSGLRVAKGDLRAPHVFSYRGMFFLVYSARMPEGTRLALASSTQTQGPYHDVHAPWLSAAAGSMGGDVFVDQNGKAYLVFSRPSAGKVSSICGSALNEDLSRCIGEPVRLLQTDQRWEFARDDSASTFNSASLFRIGSKYYLAYSVGNPAELTSAIGYATADAPLGPWIKGENNPLLSARSGQEILSPAHVSAFRAVDRKHWLLGYENAQGTLTRSGTGVIQFETLALDGIRRLVTSGPTNGLR